MTTDGADLLLKALRRARQHLTGDPDGDYPTYLTFDLPIPIFLLVDRRVKWLVNRTAKASPSLN